MRADLEVAMRRHVAVLAYRDGRLRLLPDCVVDGAYVFESTSPKEEVVRLDSGDEVRAALPFSGGVLSAELEAKRDVTLDIALAMVGKTTASRTDYVKSELRGACEDASHVVRAATIGAFAMTTGSRARLRTAAEIFGASGAAESTGSRVAEARDGTLDMCRSVGSESAPRGCSAVLRIEVVPLAKGNDATAPGKASWTMPKSCSSLEDCDARCKQSNLNACAWWVRLGEARWPRAVTNADAETLLRRACDSGDPAGCDFLAGRHQTGSEGVAVDLAKARRLYARACELGALGSCEGVFQSFSFRDRDIGYGEKPTDYDLLVSSAVRACEAEAENTPMGYALVALSCYRASEALLNLARFVTHDRPTLERSLRLAKRGCDHQDDRMADGCVVEGLAGQLLAQMANGTVRWSRICRGRTEWIDANVPCPTKPCDRGYYAYANEACPEFVRCPFGTTDPRFVGAWT